MQFASACVVSGVFCVTPKTGRSALLEGADWTLVFYSLCLVHWCKTEAPKCLAGISCIVVPVVRQISTSNLRGNEAANAPTWLRQNLKI